MKQESPDELIRRNGHDFCLVAARVVPPTESDMIAVECNEPMVGDCNAVRVSAEITDELLRAAECWLGINNPVLAKLLSSFRDSVNPAALS